MGTVIIQEYTTKNPITMIGKEAGVCWGADTSDDKKNFERGMECLKANHGRTWEFPDIYTVIDGYSARVIREFYTHIGGMPTRLQASTRYINYSDFEYVTPSSIKNNDEAWEIYSKIMRSIKQGCSELEVLGVPREDIAMALPLGMSTKIVDKRNFRNIVDMSHQRECTRAYHEYRQLFVDYKNALREYSDEWSILVSTFLKPKCEVYGYCTEKKSCGRKPKK